MSNVFKSDTHVFECRICFYCSSKSWGGLEMNIVRHAKWLQEAGHAVVVYGVKDTPIEKQCIKFNLAFKPIKFQKKYFDFSNAFRLKKLLLKDKIDVVWIRDSRDISVAGLAKYFSGNRVKIVYQQAMQIGVNKKDLLHTVRFKRIDLWLSPLEFLARQVEEKTNFPANRIKIIPLSLDANALLEKRMDRAAARSHFGIPDESLLIGLIGRIDEQKGQLILIQAVKNLLEKGIDVKLLLVGDKTKGEANEYATKIEKEIQEFKDDIFLFPFMDEVEKFYSAIDVFVMGSKAETFGTVTIEALLYGLPIIGSNAAGTPEILKRGVLGLLFEPENIENLTEKLEVLLASDRIGNDQSAKSQSKYAKEEYDYQIQLAHINQLLVDLLKQGKI